MPKREPEYPVYLSVSEMLSIQTILRKKIEHLDGEVRNQRAMAEQRSAIRDRMRYFDKINTKLYTARSKIGTMTEDEKLLFELIRQNEMEKAISVIGKMYNLESGDIIEELSHNPRLRDVVSTEAGVEVEVSSQSKELEKLTEDERLLFDWLKANNEGDAVIAITNLNEFGTKKWFSQLNQNKKLQEAFDKIHENHGSYNRLISLFLLTEGQADSERKILVL